MKAYKGTFTKKDGTLRTMKFVRLSDLPQGFLNEHIKGTGPKKNPNPSLEVVWDLGKVSFRVFNWANVVGDVEECEVETF